MEAPVSVAAMPDRNIATDFMSASTVHGRCGWEATVMTE